MTIDAMPLFPAPSLARMVASLSQQFYGFTESVSTGLCLSGLEQIVARTFVTAYVLELAILEGTLDYGDPLSIYGRPDRMRIVLGICAEAVIAFPYLSSVEDNLYSITVREYMKWEDGYHQT